MGFESSRTFNIELGRAWASSRYDFGPGRNHGYYNKIQIFSNFRARAPSGLRNDWARACPGSCLMFLKLGPDL